MDAEKLLEAEAHARAHEGNLRSGSSVHTRA
jgi:hypothetical protein